MTFNSIPNLREVGLERWGWFPKFYLVLSSEVSPYHLYISKCIIDCRVHGAPLECNIGFTVKYLGGVHALKVISESGRRGKGAEWFSDISIYNAFKSRELNSNLQ